MRLTISILQVVAVAAVLCFAYQAFPVLADDALGTSSHNQTRNRTMVFDFSSGLHGWTGGFADYPPGSETFYELTWALEQSPIEVGGLSAFYISGINHSDDLFMYLKRRVHNLKPLTTYRLFYSVEFGTNAPSNCVGVGGAAGEGVFMKAGGSTIEPRGYRLENFDKGNQAIGGRNAYTIGNIANDSFDCERLSYRFKGLVTGRKAVEVKTDRRGSLWLLVGTDSGFEAQTALYYTRITVRLVPQ